MLKKIKGATAPPNHESAPDLNSSIVTHHLIICLRQCFFPSLKVVAKTVHRTN